MSIQPGRPLLAVLRESLRKLQAANATGPEVTNLKQILRRRIADIESVKPQSVTTGPSKEQR